jgi:hypothetical protein
LTAASVFGALPPRARWFELVDSHAQPAPSRRSDYVACLLLGVALVLVAATRSALLRVALPVVLATVAVVLLVRGAKKRAAPRPQAARRGLSFDGDRVLYVDGQGTEQVLLETGDPFGVTLVANRSRQRTVAAVSSTRGTFFVGATLDASARRAFASLLARTSIVGPDEVALEAIGADGEPLDLAPAELIALIDELERANPSCLDRVVLSDARGRPVLLDGPELHVGQDEFDLTAPLEWRAIVFQEPFGQAVAVYQGTWIRQGASEVVLVSLLPSIGAQPSGELHATGVPDLDRAAIRDLRLMQATPEAPPPTEQRVAIERLFMLPLRSALDRAPRPSQQSSRARA